MEKAWANVETIESAIEFETLGEFFNSKKFLQSANDNMEYTREYMLMP